MRVVCFHLRAHHTWPQLSVCLSCVLFASSRPQLGSVVTREQEKARFNGPYAKCLQLTFLLGFLYVLPLTPSCTPFWVALVQLVVSSPDYPHLDMTFSI
jgi:hypothetical protein